tara:strand:+ start:137575 stop:137907 length:333 start_codon:yes stop_codon:yes gene_type:complete
MIFDKHGLITIVSQEKTSLPVFLENLDKAYPKLKNDHIIIDLFTFDSLKAGDILEFLQLSDKHRAAKKSFVLVTDKVNYESVPDRITVVPTLQEAKDIVEMEEIERDLGI